MGKDLVGMDCADVIIAATALGEAAVTLQRVHNEVEHALRRADVAFPRAKLISEAAKTVGVIATDVGRRAVETASFMPLRVAHALAVSFRCETCRAMQSSSSRSMRQRIRVSSSPRASRCGRSSLPAMQQAGLVMIGGLEIVASDGTAGEEELAAADAEAESIEVSAEQATATEQGTALSQVDRVGSGLKCDPLHRAASWVLDDSAAQRFIPGGQVTGSPNQQP